MIALYDRIRMAANEGKTSITFSGWYVASRHGRSSLTTVQSSAVKDRVEALGYKVSVYHGDQRDPGTSITISW